MGFPSGSRGGRGHRGRGRGGPRFGHGRGSDRGPKLPAALLAEATDTGGDHPGTGQHKSGGWARNSVHNRKMQRKHERQNKKASRMAHQVSRAHHAPAGTKRPAQEPVHAQQSAAKRVKASPRDEVPSRPGPVRTSTHPTKPDAKLNTSNKQPAPKPSTSKKTRFEELLAGPATVGAGGRGVNSAAAYMADLKAAREAEKKLGIKKGGSLKGPADGLSALLSGLSAASGAAVPAYLNKGAADQARALLGYGGNKKQQAAGAGAAGVLSDGEEEEDDQHGLGVLAAGREGSESESDDFGMALGGDSSGGDDDDDDVDDDDDDDDDDEGDDDDGLGDSESGSDGGLGMSGSELDEDVRDGGGSGDSDDMGSDLDALGSGSGSGGGSDDMYGEGALSDEWEEGEDVLGSEDMLNDSDDSDNDSDGDDGHDDDDDEEEEDQGGGRMMGAAGGGTGGKYVPPALRAAAAALSGGSTALERRVTGLLNRLADSNLPGIAKDLVDLYQSESRRHVVNTIIQQLLQAAVRGPRATPGFAMTAAALVAGVAGAADAPALTAGFIEGAAQQLQKALDDKDSLSAQNLAQLLASCHAAGCVSTELMFGLLTRLADSFTEDDVQIMVTLLGARGLALRGADPVAMKQFVLHVSNKVAQVNQAAAGGEPGGLTTRARLMLELVIDIKNNRPAKAAGGGKGGTRADGRAAGASAAVSSSTAAWLKGCNVDRVLVRGITWDKLLLPNKKGMWWQPEAGETLATRVGIPGSGSQLLAALTGGGAEGEQEAARLLALASAQRMNTDARRAVFVAVMGAVDVVDAYERLLRLPLKGDQQREVVRVIVDCCIHEASFNAFYPLLIKRLAAHSKAHRLTAQFCMWDQYKVLGELDAVPLAHLSRLNALLVAKDALPITSIKVVDLADMSQPKVLFYWRLFFQHLLAACSGPEQVREVFQRANSTASGSTFKPSLLLFLRTKFGPWLAEQKSSQMVGKVSMDELLVRLRLAEGIVRGESS